MIELKVKKLDKLVIILWRVENLGVTESGKYSDGELLQNRNARLRE
ncbi:MAG: hypothetical protein WBA93_21355 [Microcoleaceae cyanobacterium]